MALLSISLQVEIPAVQSGISLVDLICFHADILRFFSLSDNLLRGKKRNYLNIATLTWHTDVMLMLTRVSMN